MWRWVLLAALLALGGCKENAEAQGPKPPTSAAARRAERASSKSPQSPRAPSKPTPRAPPHRAPPVAERRQRASKREKSPTSDRELALQAARRAVAEEASRTQRPTPPARRAAPTPSPTRAKPKPAPRPAPTQAARTSPATQVPPQPPPDPPGSYRYTRPELALQVARDIRAKGRRYNRRMLEAFQSRAGLVPDGLYGGGTKGALRYWLGGATPPAALFQPTAERDYP